MDEHRIGLKPVLRRVWVRQGSRPLVRVQPRFHWLSVYSFVCPATGRTEWLLRPTVNTPVCSLALAHVAQAVGAGSTKHILLVPGLCRVAYQPGGGHPCSYPVPLLAALLARTPALRAALAAIQ